MKKKTLAIANTIALIVTIIINYLSNTGIFNGNTMASVSEKYHTYFTPAAYAFSIWGLIYLGLIAFIIYQGRFLLKKGKREEFDNDKIIFQIGWWFVISCIANSLWIVAWLYEYIGLSVIIMMILLFSLFKIVIRTHMELSNPPFKKIAFVWWPFCLYSGWITVALIANIAAYLAKIEWDGFGISGIIWTIIMILVAGTVNLFMTWKRNMREFSIAGVWGLVAIAVTNWYGNHTIVFTAIIVSAILFISAGIHGYKNQKRFLD